VRETHANLTFSTHIDRHTDTHKYTQKTHTRTQTKTQKRTQTQTQTHKYIPAQGCPTYARFDFYVDYTSLCATRVPLVRRENVFSIECVLYRIIQACAQHVYHVSDVRKYRMCSRTYRIIQACAQHVCYL